MFIDEKTKEISSLYNIVGGLLIYQKRSRKITKLLGEILHPGSSRKWNKNEPGHLLCQKVRKALKHQKWSYYKPRSQPEGIFTSLR